MFLVVGKGLLML